MHLIDPLRTPRGRGYDHVIVIMIFILIIISAADPEIENVHAGARRLF